ncbi:MAG: hypothetical protein K6E33_06045 [Lachnospiraceae bacterium]|nr:hypothetical protein [Lachnospiraceae bacterium]
MNKVLRGIIGVYLLYLAYGLASRYFSGQSDDQMSPALIILFTVLFAAFGVYVLISLARDVMKDNKDHKGSEGNGAVNAVGDQTGSSGAEGIPGDVTEGPASEEVSGDVTEEPVPEGVPGDVTEGPVPEGVPGDVTERPETEEFRV